MRLRKDSWRQVKFNEVSYCKEKHSKNPFDDGLTRFVGLENLNGETGKIQGFGKIEDALKQDLSIIAVFILPTKTIHRIK